MALPPAKPPGGEETVKPAVILPKMKAASGRLLQAVPPRLYRADGVPCFPVSNDSRVCSGAQVGVASSTLNYLVDQGVGISHSHANLTFAFLLAHLHRWAFFWRRTPPLHRSRILAERVRRRVHYVLPRPCTQHGQPRRRQPLLAPLLRKHLLPSAFIHSLARFA